MQTIGDRGGIAQVMVVIEDGIRERLRHVAYLLGLSHEIKYTMLDKLQDIGHTIGAMEVDISLLLTYEGFIALWLEKFPGARSNRGR